MIPTTAVLLVLATTTCFSHVAASEKADSLWLDIPVAKMSTVSIRHSLIRVVTLYLSFGGGTGVGGWVQEPHPAWYGIACFGFETFLGKIYMKNIEYFLPVKVFFDYFFLFPTQYTIRT